MRPPSHDHQEGWHHPSASQMRPPSPERSHRAEEPPPPPPPPPPRPPQQRQGSMENQYALDNGTQSGGSWVNRANAPYGTGMEQGAYPSPREMSGGAANGGSFNGMSDLAYQSVGQPGAYPAAAHASATGEPPGSTGGNALIPNFFNMQPLGQQARQQMSQQMPGSQPGAPQGVRGLTQPNLLGGGNFPQPTRAMSQQGLSFSVPNGVGMAQSGGAIPSATAPSFRVGPSGQMVSAPSRGTSFGYGQSVPRR